MRAFATTPRPAATIAARRGRIEGPNVFSFWLEAGAARAHRFSAGRNGEGRKCATCAQRLPARRGKAGKPGNLFCADGELCEIYRNYLEEQGSALPETPGDIVTTTGEVLGQHNGLHTFTVGQRKGLGFPRGSRCTWSRSTASTIASSWAKTRSSAARLRSPRYELDSIREAPDAPIRAQVRFAIATSPPQPQSRHSTRPPRALHSTSRSAPSRPARPQFSTQEIKSSAAAGFAAIPHTNPITKIYRDSRDSRIRGESSSDEKLFVLRPRHPRPLPRRSAASE